MTPDLEQEYSPSSRVGGSADPFIVDFATRSAAARDTLGDRVETLAGGTLLTEAATGAPLLVFVHGGYWQALSAAESLFLAPSLRRLGWSYAAVEYSIAPAGELITMVQQCRDALVTIADRCPTAPMVVAGHSAGAHLVAMATLVHPPPPVVRRVVLVSGVFDLRPLVHTTVNDLLGLDDSTAAALSPALHPIVGRPEVVLAWGDNETDAFKLQSRSYAAQLRAAGLEVNALECTLRHHFDIVDDLADPRSVLGSVVLQVTS